MIMTLTPREEMHRDRIKEFNGAVSVSSALWITEHYVKLHALGTSPIEPVRNEFMNFLGESLARNFTYQEIERAVLKDSPTFNGIIYSPPLDGGFSVDPGSIDLLLGVDTVEHTLEQIFLLTGRYGTQNSRSIVFCLDTVPENTLKLQDFLRDYRTKFACGWKESYRR